MSSLIKTVAEHWEFVSPLLRKPKNEEDYDAWFRPLTRSLR